MAADPRAFEPFAEPADDIPSALGVETASAPAPRPEPASSARFPVRPVAMLFTAVALVAFGLVLGATLFPQAPPSDGSASAVVPAMASPSATTRALTVKVVIDETLGQGADPWSEVQIGAPCVPRGSAFPDIDAGTSVVVADETGTILAKSTLPEGRKSGPGLCTYRTEVSVPDAKFYRVGVADRLATVFAFDELAEADWATDITFVASP
jgi:hypothetical protein